MSRQRPLQPLQGSSKWWRLTMREWGKQIASGIPKKQRRRTPKGWARMAAKPAWSGPLQRYERYRYGSLEHAWRQAHD